MDKNICPPEKKFVLSNLRGSIILFLSSSMATVFSFYILGAFSEKPYSKPLEGNLGFFPITASIQATSNHGPLQYWYDIGVVPQFAENKTSCIWFTTSILAFI